MTLYKKGSFPTRQILTVSLEGYLQFAPTIRSTPSKDGYDLVGVHVELLHGEGDESKDSLIKKFVAEVPKGAEIVVDYRASGSISVGGGLTSKIYYRTASGTALIPKGK